MIFDFGMPMSSANTFRIKNWRMYPIKLAKKNRCEITIDPTNYESAQRKRLVAKKLVVPFRKIDFALWVSRFDSIYEY